MSLSLQPKIKSKNSNQISLLKRQDISWWSVTAFKHRGKEAPLCTSLDCSDSFDASYTIEAACILPLFLTAMIFVLFFFQMFFVQWGIQRALEDMGKSLALTAGVSQQEDSAGTAAVGAAAAFHLARIRHYQVPTGFIRGGWAGMDYSDSSISDHYIEMVVHYRMEVPLKLLGDFGWNVTQSTRCRKWVGYDAAENAGDGEWVYVTPYGTSYHKDAGCAYLNPSVRAVKKDTIGDMRNDEGSKYDACRACKNRQTQSEYYYITDYGDVYHRALDCEGLKRTIYRIKADEAEAYGPCPKCAAA